jgi:hypothetical protein
LAGLQRRLASSPAAIYHSLRRRRDRLEDQATELRRLAASGKPVPVIDLPRGVRIADLDDFDFDDYGDAEREDLEDIVIDAATAAGTAHVLGSYGDRARQLAYLLYQKANDRGWASEAGAYNSLITAWPNLRTGAATVAAAAAGPTQQTLL